MKTRQTIAAMLLAAVGIWSCQQEAFQEEEMLEKDVKEGVVNEPASFKQMSVTALWQSNETRTSVYHDNDAGRYSFLWEPGDAISLVEVDPSVTEGNVAQTAQSNTLSEQCSTARFSMALEDREAGGHLYYTAYYPVSAMPKGKSASWANGAISLPLVLPATQRPGADSFDGAADLLVSVQTEQEKRPEELELQFERIGTVLKLVVTGLPAETSLRGGTLNLGYDSVGEILYNANADTHEATSVALQKNISFEYDQPLAVQGGSATIWLRVLSGVADDHVSLVLNAETAGDLVTYTRNINLMQRRASIKFKEGGVTTFSVAFDPNSVIQLIDQTSVPKLYINTQDGAAIANRVDWIQTKVKIIGDNDAVILNLNKYTDAKIRGRGNTTWSYPKKPYYLKLDKKNNLLGKSQSKKYILLANWMDRTNLRNAVAFEAARLTSMEWAPGGMFVELYLNESYNGLYYLCEKIEGESGRLNLADGDFLYTFDISNSNEWHFNIDYGYKPNSKEYGLPVEIKYPDRDDYNETDWNTFINNEAKPSFTTLNNAIHSQDIASTVDLASFCDWYLVHELCVNEEPKHPKSCYMYRKSEKFYAGPVWDFDWGTFIPTPQGTGLLPTIKNSLFYGGGDYKGLFQNPEFVRVLKERWADLKPKFDTLGNYIDVQAALIETAEAANHEMWPIQRIKNPATGQYYTNPSWDAVHANGDQDMDFKPAVNRMKGAITDRISQINKAIQDLKVPSE